jgi:1,2-diacylglycerol 3-alpha-glucosyltransferase
LGERLNIGIVTTWFDRGAAYVSKAYMKVLSHDHQVFIYARGGEKYAVGDPNWDFENVTWGSYVPYKPYMYIDWDEFKTWISDHQIDLLIFNEQRDWDIILRCLDLDIPIGAYVDYYTIETKPFFWLYDFVLCNTKRHYDVYKEHPQAFFIPWGTDVDEFAPIRTSASTEPLTFFHSCGVSPNRKGTEQVIKAFRAITADVKLVIHSQIPWEKDFPGLISLVKEDPRITLIEKTIGPPGLFHLGDVYVYPTILEGIGLTITEALSCGMPVITTDNPPMNEFIEDGYNGKLVKVANFIFREDHYFWPQSFCDQDSLIDAFQYFIDHIDQLPVYRQNARDFALRNLDWNKNAAGLSQILKTIHSRHYQVDLTLQQKVKQYESSQIKPVPYLARVKRLVRCVMKKLGKK